MLRQIRKSAKVLPFRSIITTQLSNPIITTTKSSLIHRDQETGKVFNLVAAWADKGSALKVDVPVVFKGDVCPGLMKGGSLNKIRTTLKYLCPTEPIPSKVFTRDIHVHSSLKRLSNDGTIPIGKVRVTNVGNTRSTTAGFASRRAFSTGNRSSLVQRKPKGRFHDEEIIADYVHNEMTRSFVLVLLRLFFIIVIKDVYLAVVF